MERAIAETDRRRSIQEKYNQENNITPKSINTKVKDIMEGARIVKGKAKVKKEDIEKSLPFKIKEDTVEGLSESIEKIENEMYKFAKDMEFEKAAQCRDKMKFLKRKLIDLQDEYRSELLKAYSNFLLYRHNLLPVVLQNIH